MTLNRHYANLIPATVGFDRFFDAFDALEKSANQTYPPHNIIKIDENNFVIELAIAGFAKDDVQIEKIKNELVIKGSKAEADDRNFLYRGIGTRSFKKIVHIADTVKVVDARLDNGILTVVLENRIPEEDKPILIPISSGGKKKVLLQE